MTATMSCLWLENGRIELRRVARPEPAPGEALIRVRLAGVCATDLELMRGYYPYTGIPGHEFVGEVATAPGHREWEGRRVVGEINAPCLACPTCRDGRPNHCPRRSVLGIVERPGVFAEYATLPVANLHRLPAELDDERAVFAEPLAAACRIPTQVTLRPAQRVVLLGAGRLGQLIARVLAQHPVELRVVARHAEQRRLLEAAGIHWTAAGELEPGWADVAVEATGSADGFVQARELVRPEGTLVLKSTYAGRLTADFSALVVDELTLIGSRCGPFVPAIDLLAGGRVNPRPLIAARYRLADGPAALAEAARPGVLKVLLQMPAEDR